MINYIFFYLIFPAFSVHFIDYGPPRNDVFFENNISEIKLKCNWNKYEKIILWMPTFKHIKDNNRCDIDKKRNDLELLNESNMIKVNSILQEHNSLLIVKLHPAQDETFINSIKLSNVKVYKNEDLYAKGVSVYELLHISDALITDFSSIYFDYLLKDKPIAFDISLIDDYKIGFIVDNPLEYMPGEKIKSEEDMQQFIYNSLHNIDEFKAERNELNKHFNKYIDGNSAIRILERFGLI